MGMGGEAASFTGTGLGVFKEGGGVRFTRTLLYQTNTPAWARLNGSAVAFEHDENADGSSKGVLWEWK